MVQVLEIIQRVSSTFKSEQLQEFPKLRFKYEEQEHPEEFFTPYIWTLVYRNAKIHWNADQIQLFHEEGDISSEEESDDEEATLPAVRNYIVAITLTDC